MRDATLGDVLAVITALFALAVFGAFVHHSLTAPCGDSVLAPAAEQCPPGTRISVESDRVLCRCPRADGGSQ